MTPRIALVAPNLASGGGVTSVARFLAGAIRRSSEFDCRLVSLATSATDQASLRLASPGSWIGGPCVKVDRWEGQEILHVGARFVELEFQRYQPRAMLTRVLSDCDLVQIVSGSPAWALAARDFGGPVALQVATLASVERRQRAKTERDLVGAWRRLMTPITARLDRAGARLADCLFVENDWMRRTLSDWTAPERVTVAPPGVDTDLFQPGSSTANSGGCEPYILSVGRFADPRKNLSLLLEAYARLRALVPNCPRLVLAGKSPPSPSDWKLAQQLGLGASVDWQGKLSLDRLAALYRGALLFALSSSEEGLGLVLVEAMSSGIPVVATRTEGAHQVVVPGETGFLVPLNDAVALAHAMAQLVADSEMRLAMGHKARQRAERVFSEKVTETPYLSAYRELLGLSRRLLDSTPTGTSGKQCRELT